MGHIRERNAELIDAWIVSPTRDSGRELNAVWSQHGTLFSYGTAIATTREDAPRFVVNTTRYSVTTSHIQAHLRTALEDQRINFVSVTDLPQGVQARDLVRASYGEVITSIACNATVKLPVGWQRMLTWDQLLKRIAESRHAFTPTRTEQYSNALRCSACGAILNYTHATTHLGTRYAIDYRTKLTHCPAYQ
jgi:hypothetical protein